MKRNVDVFLQHGWGFNRALWASWAEPTNSYMNWCFHKLDHGYLNSGIARGTHHDTQMRSSKGEGKRDLIIVAHSFGLQLVPLSLLAEAKAIFLLGAFLSFGSGSNKIIQRMKRRLSQEPKRVLLEFYSRCFMPNAIPEYLLEELEEARLNNSLLTDDLEILDGSTFGVEILKKLNRIFVLHGSDDVIVSCDIAREQFACLSNTSFETIHGGVHALPVTHRDVIWSRIVSLTQKEESPCR